jgi:UDP-N-acetylmuramate dehydrogenase
VQKNVPLSSFTTWKVGGPADFFVLVKTKEDILGSVRWAQSRGLPVTVLGGGSNVLISDDGVEGLVLCTQSFVGTRERVEKGRLIVTAKSGTPKFEVLRRFLKHKLAPALFLSGLPGDVGGGVVMNAGVAENRRPREFAEFVDRFWVLNYVDLSETEVDARAVRWSYRHSEGWGPGVIVEVEMSWPLEPEADLPRQVKEANLLRLSKQPLEWPSCGSTFVNPPGEKAGQLIDRCGLKGFSIGGGQISAKHANFFINKGGATARDFARLIRHAQDVVKGQTGIELRTEVRWLGRW